jgi:hypothetical protein
MLLLLGQGLALPDGVKVVLVQNLFDFHQVLHVLHLLLELFESCSVAGRRLGFLACISIGGGVSQVDLWQDFIEGLFLIFGHENRANADRQGRNCNDYNPFLQAQASLLLRQSLILLNLEIGLRLLLQLKCRLYGCIWLRH